MDPDVPQSPLAPDCPPQSSAQPIDPSGEPEQPRLGILHLLVWPACVAVYLGILGLVFPTDASGRMPVHWVLNAIGSGAALGGLLLWVARRLRGWRFPRYPGEYLLAALGLCALLFGLWYPLSGMLVRRGANVFPSNAVNIALTVVLLGRVAVFVWAGVRVKVRRWRWLLLAIAVESALPAAMLWVGPLAYFRPLWLGYEVAQAAIVVWLVALSGTDHLRGFRYPWTHWLGVAVPLWQGALVLATWVANVWTYGIPS